MVGPGNEGLDEVQTTHDCKLYLFVCMRTISPHVMYCCLILLDNEMFANSLYRIME